MIAEPNVERAAPIIPQTEKTQKPEKITHKESTANPSAPKWEPQPKTKAQTTERETPKIPPRYVR